MKVLDFNSYLTQINTRRRDMLERIIQILYYVASHPDASINEIAKNLHMNNYVCGRYIDNMKAMGLVEIREQGKAKRIRLTKKGYQALMVAMQLLQYIPLEITKVEERK